MIMLTPRQHEIMEFACEGLSAKEMARHLNVSPRTIEVHMVNMTHAVAMYLQRKEPAWKL